MSISTAFVRPFSPSLLLVGLAFVGLGLGCDEPETALEGPLVVRGFDLEESEAPALSVAEVLAEAEAEGYVEIPLAQLSDATLQDLEAMSEEIPPFESEAQQERFLAYARGERVLRNSSPLGEPEAGFDWSELSTVEEHGRVFEFLSQRGLLAEVEDELPAGTWLTSKTVAESLTPAESEDLATFEFESFVSTEQSLDEGGPAPLDNNCGSVQVDAWCGECTFSDHFAWNHYIQMWLKTCHRRWFDNCTCLGSEQWAEFC